ncbi:MAG TPA: isocitrate/isopropylmalate family dehydrogenase [Burkholderiaceae bacterium]|nr:isocitrate/isopropylmalate family dehydrogenase [Burkholderiaceae bacterium]
MRIILMPGDGIGPEITAATIKVLDLASRRLGLGLLLEEHAVGFASLKSNGAILTREPLQTGREADGMVLGPVSHSDYPPRAEVGINVSSELRVQLDLYADIRPSRSREGLPHWGRTRMDLVIVRENTEGFYSDRNMFQGSGEFMPDQDMALSVRKITAKASSRIASSAFELARKRRRKVTAVHKANVVKVSDALFLREVRKVAQAFPDVAYDEQLVDSMAALLVRDARRFDVVVTTNMFGEILSDEAAELSGSLGLGGAVNASATHCMAQAQHGSAPDIAGQDKANPTSLILSASLLLAWLSTRHEGRTSDLGGPLGTRAFTDALCSELEGVLAR